MPRSSDQQYSYDSFMVNGMIDNRHASSSGSHRSGKSRSEHKSKSSKYSQMDSQAYYTNTDRSTRRSSKSVDQQRPHHVVEKRYRSNLNNTFEDLRQCLVEARSLLGNDPLPSDRYGMGAGDPLSAVQEEYGQEDQEGVKMTKARVLSEAVDYIHFLEAQNDRAAEDVEQLQYRLSFCQHDQRC